MKHLYQQSADASHDDTHSPRGPQGLPSSPSIRVRGPTLRAGSLMSAVALCAACQGTQLGLIVRAPGEADATARVRLLLEDRPTCVASNLYTGKTNANGELHIVTESCGPVRLVVSRAGKRTVERHVDTCDEHGAEVILWPAAAPREPEDPCSLTANEFLRAWATRDEARARALWIGPKDFTPQALTATEPAPWAIDVAPGVVTGEECHVRARLSYEDGCEAVKDLDLAQRDGTWRVLGFRAL